MLALFFFSLSLTSLPSISMARAAWALVAVAAVAAVAVAAPAAAVYPRRLIALSPERRVWMTEEQVRVATVLVCVRVCVGERPDVLLSGQVFGLIRTHTPFIDVTETPDLEKLPRPARTLAFPAGPQHQDEVNRYILDADIDRFRDDLTTFSSFFTRYYAVRRRAPPYRHRVHWQLTRVPTTRLCLEHDRRAVGQLAV
jgi:hypothetical protein